jgi:hypothetical protein
MSWERCPRSDLETPMPLGLTILTTLAGSRPGQRLQVALAQRPDGRLVIDLREQHYAEGIGWFDQKALDLDPRQFQQLQAALGLRATLLDAIEDEAPATLPFPGPRTSGVTRPAVGDGC